MLGGYLNIQARPTPQIWVAPVVVAPPGDALTVDRTDITVDDATITVDETIH